MIEMVMADESISVAALGQFDPLIDFLFLLFALAVINDFAEQFVDELLDRVAGLVLGELDGIGVVLLVVAEVEAGNHVVQRVFWLRSQNQSVHAVHYLPKGEGRAVVPVEDRVADAALRVHVAVVDGGNEADFWSFEGVVTGELGVEQEKSVFVGCFLGPQQQYFPEVDVGAGKNGHEGVRVVGVDLDFLGDALEAAVGGDLLGLLGFLHFFEDVLGGKSASLALGHVELMDVVR